LVVTSAFGRLSIIAENALSKSSLVLHWHGIQSRLAKTALLRNIHSTSCIANGSAIRYHPSARFSLCAPLTSTRDRREVSMLRITAAVTLGSLAATIAFAQTAPPTYQGDPDVYKVIFEDQNFRVIAATRKKGVHDKEHGHPLPSVVYNITDCTTKTYTPDGKTSEIIRKAGTASAVSAIPSHSAENTGAADCQQLFVERK
jgi:hypothetical protein